MSIISKANPPREYEDVCISEALAEQYGIRRWAVILDSQGGTKSIIEAQQDFPGSEAGTDSEIITLDLDGFEMTDRYVSAIDPSLQSEAETHNDIKTLDLDGFEMTDHYEPAIKPSLLKRFNTYLLELKTRWPFWRH